MVLQGVHFNSLDGNPGQIVLKLGNKFPDDRDPSRKHRAQCVSAALC